MSGLMGDLEQAASSKMNKDAQPGDNIERTADQDANQGKSHSGDLLAGPDYGRN
jgi:hypothetical protein